MKKTVFLAAYLLIFSLSMVMISGHHSSAEAMFAPGADIDFYIGGQKHESHLDYDESTGVYHLSSPALFNVLLEEFTNIPLVRITVPSLFIKWDPYVTYRFEFENNTSQPYTVDPISFSTYITMTQPGNTVSAFLNGNTNNAQQISQLGYDSAGPWTNAGVNVMLGENKGPQSGPDGYWSYAQLTIDGITIPVGTSYLAGEFRINPVPLPATLWLLGTGISALAGAARRFNK